MAITPADKSLWLRLPPAPFPGPGPGGDVQCECVEVYDVIVDPGCNRDVVQDAWFEVRPFDNGRLRRMPVSAEFVEEELIYLPLLALLVKGYRRVADRKRSLLDAAVHLKTHEEGLARVTATPNATPTAALSKPAIRFNAGLILAHVCSSANV